MIAAVAVFWFWTAAAWTSGVLVGVALASTLTPNKEPPTVAGQDAIDEAEAIVRGGER